MRFTHITHALLIATFVNTSGTQPFKIHLYNSYVFDEGIDAVTSGNNFSCACSLIPTFGEMYQFVLEGSLIVQFGQKNQW